MPNGHQGSKQEWERMEAPLLRFDPILDIFAKAHGLAISKNYHSWPERSLKWGQPVHRLIQLFLENEQKLTFTLWLCASEDRSTNRYWKNVYIFKDKPTEYFESCLSELLTQAYQLVGSWTSDNLVFATNLTVSY